VRDRVRGELFGTDEAKLSIFAEKIFQIFSRPFRADPRQQLRDALEGEFVLRVGDELEICGGVLDVCLLEEPDAAGDGRRDVALREFKLPVPARENASGKSTATWFRFTPSSGSSATRCAMNAACCAASAQVTSAGFKPDLRAGASSLVNCSVLAAMAALATLRISACSDSWSQS